MTVSTQSDARVRRLELAISYALRAGVLCSLALIVAGLALTVAQTPESSMHGSIQDALDSGKAPFTTWGEVIHSLRSGDGQALVMLGVLVLISTPVTRVAVSIGLFALQKDNVFVAITAVVFGLLILSFLLGGVET
jgi:uncharacterized membrane protein